MKIHLNCLYRCYLVFIIVDFDRIPHLNSLSLLDVQNFLLSLLDMQEKLQKSAVIQLVESFSCSKHRYDETCICILSFITEAVGKSDQSVKPHDLDLFFSTEDHFATATFIDQLFIDSQIQSRQQAPVEQSLAPVSSTHITSDQHSAAKLPISPKQDASSAHQNKPPSTIPTKARSSLTSTSEQTHPVPPTTHTGLPIHDHELLQQCLHMAGTPEAFQFGAAKFHELLSVLEGCNLEEVWICVLNS